MSLEGRYTTDYDVPGAHAVVCQHLASDPERFASYMSEVDEYLQWYERMRVPKVIRFGQVDTQNDPFAPYRTVLIERFLSVVRDYIPVNVIYEPVKQTLCGCGTKLEDALNVDGVVVCPTCSVVRARIGRKKSATANATEETTPRRRQDSEERDNFIKALHRYQGMQRDRLPVDLVSRLDAFFSANNYPTSKEVRDGHADSTLLSKDVMYKALASVGCPMYEHINLICHKVWGWPLPVLHDIYDTVLQHFDAMQHVAVSQNIPTINTQYRLFKHLEMAGYKCHAQDFRIPKTREIIQADEDRWRALCEGVDAHGRSLGIKFIPTM